MEKENNIVSGAASTDVGATYSDEEFIGGFSDSFGFTPEISEEGAESEEGNIPEKAPEGPVGDKGPEGERGVPEGNGRDAAESGGEGSDSEENIIFKEHGKEFSAPKTAVEAFAKAVGRTSESLIDIYQKGCNYDALSGKLEELRKEGELLGELAKLRGLSKDQFKAEILDTLEKIPLENLMKDILAENPGMKEETARELARFRIGEQKPKVEAPKAENEVFEANEGMLRELEIFKANHPEVGDIPNEAVEAWEKSGIPLERAFEMFGDKEELRELREEVENLRKVVARKEQKEYAKSHSTGSAGSAAGDVIMDEFIEGLFKEY